MKTPNFYAANPLDRLGNTRKQPEIMAELLEHPNSRFLPLWRNAHLVSQAADGPVPLFLKPGEAEKLLQAATEKVLLGVAPDETAYIALDLAGPEAPLDLAREAIEAASDFADLRALGLRVERDQGAILAHARGMLHWHRQHRFCGVCGSATVSAEAGHVRHCTNPDCGTHHFPRTDPAVIMLVHDGDRCLLGRQARWPKGRFSTLAGFVEPGEALEDTVAREVFEETGVLVGDIVYHSSQPWPFPASIMLGFWAEARSTEIKIDQNELDAARWFSRDWLLEHRTDPDFNLPPPDSISRRLIEDWLAIGA